MMLRWLWWFLLKFVVNEVVMLDVHSGGPSEKGSEEDEPVG